MCIGPLVASRACAPSRVLAAAGLFNATVHGVAEFRHLWTHPILHYGAKYTAHFGAIPQTPLAHAIAMTRAWHRAHPQFCLQS